MSKSQVEILELQITVTNVKNSVDGFNDRSGRTEGRISNLENKWKKICKIKHWEQRMENREERLRDILDVGRSLDILVIGIWEGNES